MNKNLIEKIILFCFVITMQRLVSNNVFLPQYKSSLITEDHTINKNCRTLLEDTIVIDAPADLHQQTAEISYLFIDVKINPDTNEIKVCEFGEAKNASPKAQCPIYVNNTLETTMCAPFCNLFWHYLSQFNIPIWYVGQNPDASKRRKDSADLFKGRIGWHSLHVIGGYQATSLSQLRRNPFFKWYARAPKTIIPDTISSYKGIIFYRDRDDIEEDRFHELEKFRRDFPDFITIDVVSRPYAASKALGCQLFDDEATTIYKPQWKEYPKLYSPLLVQQILNDFSCDTFVIKPVNSGRSNGILMTNRDDLDEILQSILPDAKNIKAINFRPKKPITYDYWDNDKNKTFVIEEFFHGKTTMVHGKPYDPAIRAYAIMRYEQGKIYVNVLQGFMKIPPKALTDEGSFLDKHRTGSGFSGRGSDKARALVRGLPIPPEDTLFLREKLKEIFPKVYLKMLQKGPQKFF